MSRAIGAIARYTCAGGAGVAAYDMALNEGSVVSQVVKELVASATKGVPPSVPLILPAGHGATHTMELAELSAKLDKLTTISIEGMSRRARDVGRVSTATLLLAAGVAAGALAVWAVWTGRWWPSINGKLESVESAIGVLDAKVDTRAAELSAQLRESHGEVMTAVTMMSESIRVLDTRVERIDKRIDDMDDIAKENNKGIHILCEVVAKNFDLRQCPAPVLKRLYDFSGAEEPEVPPPDTSRPAQIAPPPDGSPAPQSLMQYLVSPR